MNTNGRENEGLQIVDRRLWVENGSAASSSPFQLSALTPLRSVHAK
jgi:hypothetical protein